MLTRSLARPGLALLFALLALSPAVSAQRLGSISGTVRAAGQGPFLEGARVVLVGTALLVSTSSKGEFAFHGLTPGRYVIQASAIGYATLSSPVDVKALETLEVEFETEPSTVRLPDVEVAVKPNLPADFARRSVSGGGRYYSRADIEKRAAATVGDLLRTVPGMRVDCRGPICRVQLMRAPRNCPPAFFLDGVPANAETVMLQPPRDLEGIEVYSGPAETPPELERLASCGAIALWTRMPPPWIRKDKKPKQEKKDTTKPPPPKLDTASVTGLG
jgi:hypothetical protein